MKHFLAISAACGYACGNTANGDLVSVTSTMTVTAVSGSGTSPLEPLVGQQLAFTITFAAPSIGHEPANGCPTTDDHETVSSKVATGATAALVQSDVLDILSDWEAVLNVCTPASGSSITLRSDNEAGLGLVFACFDLPPSALGIDGAGEPRWSSFQTTGRCDATLYDQLHGRTYGGSGLEMKIVAD
ncbi:MAG: hypothetical protein ABI678_29390 [Kofleriaceae bacterium]